MKVRVGFVSNSSSSSFLILGDKIFNPEERILAGAEVYAVGYGCGTSGDVEDWCVKLEDKKSYDLLVNSQWFKRLEDEFVFIEAEATFHENQKRIHISKEIDCNVYIIQKDYSSPCDFKELKNFLEEEDNFFKTREIK